MASFSADPQRESPRAASEAEASSPSVAQATDRLTAPGLEFERTLADVEGPRPGPTVVFVGGIHGNEPAGALACARLAPLLQALRAELAGRVVLLSGNRAALRAGLRFVQRDLNRGWAQPQLARLATLPARDVCGEDREQLELWQLIERLERERRGPLVAVDLHTTSGPSAPFVCLGDTLANRQLAACLPATAILGLEEVIEGVLAGFLTDRGHIAIAIEAGQHQDPRCVTRLLAAVSLALIQCGCLRSKHFPELPGWRAELARAAAGQPALVEVRHRHVVAQGDEFEMVPGFSSFVPVARGQLVARDRWGGVRAPESGLMLMPRYQGQGEDGYFLVRAIRPAWLHVSALLRRARAERLLPSLPGLHRHAELPGALVIHAAVARAQLTDLLHLCGYRRRRSSEPQPVFSRRTEAALMSVPRGRMD